MGRITNLLLARRDAIPAPVRVIGQPTDGGLLMGGVTATTALGLSAVWRCLDILSNGVSQLTWKERRGTLDLPPSRLVTRPQSWRTRREWTSLVVSTVALFDCCYLLKVGGEDSEGVPIGLWPLDPSIVQPVTTGVYGAILPPDEYWVGQTKVSADQLVIVRRSPQPGILDGSGGVISIARTTFAAALAAESYASRYWQAGGAPTTVLETDANLPDPVATALSDRWREKRSKGPDYAPVMSSGVKAKSFGADPTAESAVEARRELVADISRYFGVSSHIVNAPSGDSQTYKSSETTGMDFLRFTLQNYINAIQDAISDLLPGGRYMVMDVEPLIRTTYYAQAQALQLATAGKAWMSVDEARDAIGLAPAERPDELNPPPAPVVVAANGGSNGGQQG